MLIKEMAKIELIGSYIGFMLITKIAKMNLTGDQFGIILIIEMAKIELSKRLSWNYTIYRDGQNRMIRRPYWIYVD